MTNTIKDIKFTKDDILKALKIKEGVIICTKKDVNGYILKLDDVESITIQTVTYTK